MAGILAGARPVVIIGTGDHRRAAGFYRDTLGLHFVDDDGFAAVFDMDGTMVRVSTVPNFVPAMHTVLAFAVADIAAAASALAAKGVHFNRYPQFAQDEDGIHTTPDGRTRLAWFHDDDGNVLGLAQL